MHRLHHLLLGCIALLAGCDGLGDLGTLPPGLSGVVYHDEDGNGLRNAREKGLARVIVSNGRDVVLTDVRGRWLLPIDGPRVPFVIAPRGWRLAEGDQDGQSTPLYRWTPSRTPTIVVGAVPVGPKADAQLCSALDGPTCTMPCDPPSVMNVGDLLVLYVGDTLNEDDRTFIKALLAAAGSDRTVFIVYEDKEIHDQVAMLCKRGSHGAHLSQQPFKATMVGEHSMHVRFSDEQD